LEAAAARHQYQDECCASGLPKLRHTAIIERHEEASFCHTLGHKLLEGVLQLLKGHFPRESGLEGSDNLTHLLGALVDELQPEVPNLSLELQWHVFRANLRFGPEDCVATPHIRHHRVHLSGFVLQCHTVRFTGVSAVRVVSAGGQKAAEDAVLSVKHGEMLVDDHLQSVCCQVVG
jgi:hypothetical protein